MTTIRYWFNEFKRGRTSVFDEERPGRPVEVSPDLAPCDFFLFPNMKNGLAESGSRQTRKSSTKQRPILRSSTNHIFGWLKKSWNIAGLSVSS